MYSAACHVETIHSRGLVQWPWPGGRMLGVACQGFLHFSVRAARPSLQTYPSSSPFTSLSWAPTVFSISTFFASPTVMTPSQSLLFFFVAWLFTFASSIPLNGHQRRSTCHRNVHASSVLTPSVVVTSTSTVKSESVSPSVKPIPPSTAPINHPSTGALAELFPASTGKSSWTTSQQSSVSLPLADSTFRPQQLLTSLTHSYVSAPDGKRAMKAHYPKGSYTFTHHPLGGISFYAPGPASVDLTTAKEATFGYSVMFEEGYDWNLGGKLPGLYGGTTPEISLGCSGGRRSRDCFSARLMWRQDGAGELYTYLPMDGPFAVNKVQCDAPPFSTCNPTYGASVGRGAFSFAAGEWTTVSQRLRLNDVGQANGELELFVGGKSVINVSGLMMRERNEGRIRGIQMQTFFGGSSEDYASPKDQSSYFSDFSVAVTETL